MTSTLVVGAALSAQAQSSVCVEFADGGVGCDDEGEAVRVRKLDRAWVLNDAHPMTTPACKISQLTTKNMG